MPIVEEFKKNGTEYEINASGGKDEVYALFKGHIDAAVEKVAA